MAGDVANKRIAWERCEDRTLYFTLSLYIDAGDIPADIARGLALSGAVAPLADFQGTQDLRDAVDPLLNDIANRERLGRVEDFLLDVKGPPDGERVQLITPRIITWTTEGTTFRIDLGADQAREARARRFWYVHLNGALSYHVSLAMTYDPTPADFYAISMLQKAAAPKEFKQVGGGAFHVHDGRTGFLPLDAVMLAASDGRQALWPFIAKRFEADARDLFAHIRKGAPKDQDDATMQALVHDDPFLETPGLAMPRARFLFFFQDEKFFDALLPPPEMKGGALTIRRRIDCIPPSVYARYPTDIQAMIDAAEANRASADTPLIVDVPLSYIDAIDNEHLRYLFLAGFNQNIIDFLNQDASEILDSTDPIYPAKPEQEEESFFVRYANPRTLITYVKRSRSLEAGNDWIGTCPYAFLIHVMALHNEYFVRAYEHEAEKLVEEVQDADNSGELRRAADKFYKFRRKQFSNYMRNRYLNVFRYDTEKDVFAELERIRGVAKKVSYLETLVSGVEKQTHDLEERLKEEAKEQAGAAREREEKISRRDANRLTYLLALLSIGGFLFDFVAKLSDMHKDGAITFGLPMGINPVADKIQGTDIATLVVMIGIFLAMLFGGYLFLRKKI